MVEGSRHRSQTTNHRRIESGVQVFTTLSNWIHFKKHRVGALGRLAEQLGYPSASNKDFTIKLQLLTERKQVVIQQSGYVGDSLHHIKLVSMTSEAFQFLQRTERQAPIETHLDISRHERVKATRRLIRHGRSSYLLPYDLPSGAKLDAINMHYIAKLSRHGRALYFRLPQPMIEWFGLAAGDKLKVCILQRKKWAELEAAEE